MAEISATFRNAFSASRRWVIVDRGRDPNSPALIFNDFLGPDEVTPALGLFSADGIFAQITYQRSDGAPTLEDSVTDGSEVRME